MTKIEAERVGNRIHIKPTSFLGGERFQMYLAEVRMVPGSAFNRGAKCQTAPLDIEVCRNLREIFGDRLLVGTALSAWARAELEREKETLDIHTLDLTKPVALERVPTLAPKMYTAMQARGFQPVAAKFGALVRNFINADDPGLGKSIEMFGALLEGGIRGRALIFAPSSALRTTWEHEIYKWLSELPGGVGVWVADGTTANRQAVLSDYKARSGQEGRYLDFLVVNPEMIRLKEQHSCPNRPNPQSQWGCDGTDPYCDAAAKHKTVRESKYPELFETMWNAVIGDEMHKYMTNANPNARRRMSQQGLGIQRLPRAEGGVRIALTGTPMKGKPRLIWPVLHWLRPDYYTSEYRFKAMYFAWEHDPYAHEGKKYLDAVRPEMQEAFHRELSRTMIRRTKAELIEINPAWAPPPKLYHYIPIHLGAAQRKAYDRMEKSAEIDGSLVNGTLAVRTRLKQLAGCSGLMQKAGVMGGEQRMVYVPKLPSAKFEWLVGLLESLGITGDPKTEQGDRKIVVASQFTQFINLWAAELRALGIDCHVLTGETTSPERLRQQQEFQAAGGPRVFLLNTHAGGVSLTLDAADDLVIMDRTENPDDQTQVEDRIHRTSRVDHQVNIWYPYVVNTIEEEIAAISDERDANQRAHLDGRRGVAFAKHVVTAGEAQS